MPFCRITTPIGLGMELPCAASVTNMVITLVADTYSTLSIKKCSSKVASVSVMSFYLMRRFQEFLVKDNHLNLGNPSEGMCMGLNWLEGGLRELRNSL